MNQLGFPTQADLAQAAGVSRSTVSRALSNHPSIPEETRRKILEVSNKLGYHPDPFVTANMLRVRSASAIRSGAAIGYLTPNPLEPKQIAAYFYLDSARQQAARLGFTVDVIVLNDPKLSGQRCTNILLARGVRGLLIAPFENPYIRLQIDWSKFASASIGYGLVRPRLSFAANNHYYTMTVALRNLRRLGYQRIGLAIPSRADHYSGEMFSAAYALYADTHMAQNRIPRLLPHWKDWTQENFTSWYKTHRPDAVICITDDVREWLASLKIHAPSDIGLVHLNWNQSKKDWSGINEHNELVGSAALQLVADQLLCNERGIPPFPKCVLIEGEWVEGGTVRSMLKPSQPPRAS